MRIKKDSIGPLVLDWQEFLVSVGYDIGSLDGIFGSKTDAATRDWQARNGLESDGIVGDDSFAKARTLGFKPSAAEIWYPPRPSFGSPTPAQVKQMFGEFDFEKTSGGEIRILGNWVAQNIVTVEIKQIAGLPGAPADGKIRFHRKGAAQLKALFEAFESEGLNNLVISWAGSFYPRLVRKSTSTLSNHSWGTAFDINAKQNWLDEQPARVGQKGSLLKLVPIANSFGFFWGGHYKKRLDGMHFELAVLDMYPSS
jgi:hypothetical protein